MTINIDVDDYLETIILDIADTGFSGYQRLAEKFGGIPQGQGPWLDAAWQLLQDKYGLPWQVATGIMGRVVRKDKGVNIAALDPTWTAEELDQWRSAGYWAAAGLANVIRAKRMLDGHFEAVETVELVTAL